MKQYLSPREAINVELKEVKKEDGHNEKNEENKTRKQLPKAPSSDIVKERDALKKEFISFFFIFHFKIIYPGYNSVYILFYNWPCKSY